MNKICRSCVRNSGSLNEMIPIDNEIFEDCTGIRIETIEDINIDKTIEILICQKCKVKIEEIFRFRKNCKDSQKLYSDFYKAFKLQPIVKLETFFASLDEDFFKIDDDYGSQNLPIVDQNDSSDSDPKALSLPALQKLHTCKKCSKNFNFKSNLSKHMKVVHSFSKQNFYTVKCNECGKKVKNKDTLKHHILKLHPKTKEYECKICRNSFARRKKFLSHLKQKHGVYESKLKDQELSDYLIRNKDIVTPIPNLKTLKYQLIKVSLKKCSPDIQIDKHDQPSISDRNSDDCENTKQFYQCPKCDKSYDVLGSFLSHMMQKHIQSFKYKCKRCTKRFMKLGIVRKHIIDQHSINPANEFQCTKCLLTFKRKEYYVRHLRRIHFKDTEINKKEIDENLLRIKREREIFDYKSNVLCIQKNCKIKCLNKYLCKLCGQKFTNQNYLNIHIKISHRNYKKILIYNCEICKKHSSISEINLKYHLTRMHYKFKTIYDLSSEELNQIQTESIKKIWLFKKCASYKTKRKVKHLRNKEAANIKNSLECTHCTKKFSSITEATTHIQSHRNQSEQFQCQECGKVYHNVSSLRTHIITHGEKKFKCTYEDCRKAYFHIYELKNHMLSHSSDGRLKRFQCIICGAFKRSQNELKIHIMIHNDERPYKCEHCDKRFVTQHHLKAHMPTHTGEKKYKCQECNLHFVKKFSLDCHYYQNHFPENKKKIPCDICGKMFGAIFVMKKHRKVHGKTMKTQSDSKNCA